MSISQSGNTVSNFEPMCRPTIANVRNMKPVLFSTSFKLGKSVHHNKMCCVYDSRLHAKITGHVHVKCNIRYWSINKFYIHILSSIFISLDLRAANINLVRMYQDQIGNCCENSFTDSEHSFPTLCLTFISHCTYDKPHTWSRPRGYKA